MSYIPSNSLPVFDGSQEWHHEAARDLGEVIAILSGGHRSDAETASRLAKSMRSIQGRMICVAASAPDQVLRETADILPETSVQIANDRMTCLRRELDQPPQIACRSAGAVARQNNVHEHMDAFLGMMSIVFIAVGMFWIAFGAGLPTGGDQLLQVLK